MFWTRVTTAIEEIKHFHWCPAENQLPVVQNGDFVKELVGQQMVLAYNQVTTSSRKKSFQAISPLMVSAVLQYFYCIH